MKRALSGFAAFAFAFLAAGCGTSSTTVTGPSLDRCAITVVNSLTSVGAAGGSGRLTVTAGRECTWSVTSSAPWITATPPAGGQGDGTVDYVVAANPSPDARRGSVSMGGQVLEVVQEGLTCRFDLQPTSQNIGAEGGSGSFTVETASGCNWTPAAAEDWITITNGGSQGGNGSVNFTVAANTGGARDGIIRIGGQAFTILQSAPLCRFQLSAIAQTFSGTGGSGTVNVTGPNTCNWTAASNVPWISIVGNASDNGNGTVSFTVQANTGPARNGILTIGGLRFTVTQLQAECNYSIAPAGQSFSVGGGQGTVTVATNSVCTWNTSDVPAWVTGMPASGTGPQTIAFTVDANQGPARNVAIIIGGQSFAVSQAAGCSYSLAAGSHNPPAGGGASSLAVNTAGGCAWTTSGVPAWITGVPANGTGPQTINFVVAANSGLPRSANILIAGQTFAVNQAGGCTYSLTPGSHNAPTSGGASSFAVNTAAGCGWTSSGVPSWITRVPASGTGPQTINFTVAANSGATRTANVVIGGQTFVVTQAAIACSYSLNPSSHIAAAAGGSSAFDVSTTSGCSWTSSGVPAWITGIPGNGSGTTTINFSVGANTDPSPRNVNITIAGQTFTVTQAGVACNYSLNPTSHNAGAAGGSSSFNVNTTSSCGWTSSGVPSWITGVPANGTGTTTISFTVAANPDPASRSANISIGGQTFAITQAGVSCNYSLNPTSHNAPAAGGASAFDVNTTSNCGWTSSGVPSWIAGVPANGTGTTTINFTVAANPDPASRSANISIGGQTFAITQAGVSCNYSLNPTSYNAAAAGGASAFDVNTASGCGWTSSGVPSWITGVPANGTGTTTINFTVAANSDPASRSANISVGGQTFAVTQAGGSCSYSLNPTSHNAAAAGGSSTFAVNTTAGCGWTSSGVPSWITGVPGSGTSTTTVNFTVAANTGPARSATIVIEGQTFAVSQANGCTYSVTPGTLNFRLAGTPPKTITVTTDSACPWTATASDGWIRFVSGSSGTGSGTIDIELDRFFGLTRNGNVTVGGQTVTIIQDFP